MSVCLVMCFPHDKPRHCVLFRREAPRAHNLEITWPFQGQFNLRFGTTWQHDFGSPREPPFKRSRMINFLCPDIARHIDVQQLSIHIEGFMFKTNASIPPGRQQPGTLGRPPNALICDDVVCFIMGMATTLPGHCVLPRRGHHMSVCIVTCLVSIRQAPTLRFIQTRNTRAHNLENGLSKKGQFKIRFGTI